MCFLKVKNLIVLRKYHHSVGADTNFSGARETVEPRLPGFNIERRMVREIWSVVIRVAVKACSPKALPGKSDRIAVTALGCHIYCYDHAVFRTLFVPPVESEDL